MNYAWFVESLSDKVVSMGTTTYNTPASSMTTPFFTAANPDGINTDLCGTANVVGHFERADGTTYALEPQMFVRGRPPHR